MFEPTTSDPNNKIGLADRMGYFLSSIWGIFAPAAQVRMDAARMMKGQLRSINSHTDGIDYRSYNAASTNRFNKNRVSTDGTANAELLNTNALATIRKVTRDIIRNSPIGKAAKRALAAHIVGKGVTLQANATNSEGEPLPELNRKIERFWKIWSGSGKQCDARRKKSYNRFLNQGIGQLAEGGEYIINKTARRDPGNLLALKLEAIENDLLDEKLTRGSGTAIAPIPLTRSGEAIIGGIEIDKFGAPINYNFLRFDRNFLNITHVGHNSIPARQIIHAYVEDRPGQLRGEPWFASCLGYLQTADRAVQAELFTLEVQACLSVVYKSATGGAKKFLGAENVGANPKIDANNNRIRKLSPGAIFEIPGADDIKVVDPKRPGGTFEPYIKFVLRFVAASLGMSYSKIAKDYSDGNFSSKKMEDSDDTRHIETFQDWYSDEVNVPVYEDFVEELVLRGLITAPNFLELKPFYLQSKWTFTPKPFQDPLKDAAANRERLKDGTLTLKDFWSERGVDFRDVIEQIGEEAKLLAQKGVILDRFGNATPGQSAATTASDMRSNVLTLINQALGDKLLENSESE